MIQLSMMQKIIVWVLPVLFAITVHEVAHGWMASKLGDQTVKRLGRLTLNPLKHIDLIGTVLVPILLLMVSPVVFGWAKPVPITPQNLKHPRRDMAFVALAGPLSNFIMALIWAAIMKVGLILTGAHFRFAEPIMLMGQAGIMINLVLMVLNLIPIPPLDGGRILSSVLPPKMAYHYDKIERYGFFILLILIFTRIINVILWPPIILLSQLIAIIFRLK